MGYSCTVDAGNMLGVIGKMFATDGNPNILTINGSVYFFERGREQADGRITGSLYKMLPDNLCIKAESVCISASGLIKRFPAMTSKQKEEAGKLLDESSASQLDQWAMGRI